MEAKDLFERVLIHAGKVVGSLPRECYKLQTPDTTWDAGTLANHMLYELSWVPEMVSGKTIEEVGNKYEGNLVGTNPVSYWNKAAARALEAVKNADMNGIAHLSYGDVPIRDYLREISGDIFIHSWDLAASLGHSRKLDTALIRIIYEDAKSKTQAMADSGLYHPPLNVPTDADMQTKLLALFGRDVEWQPEIAL